jgi:tRNA-specific 2-thiouridylase
MYVVDIDPATNRVTLGERDELLRTRLVAKQINVLNGRLAASRVPVIPSVLAKDHGHLIAPTPEIPREYARNDSNTASFGVPCQAKIRYNHQPQPAHAWISGEDELTVHFEQPQPAVTPGQAVVLYDGEVVLGGGWIEGAE